jgi:repressor LexA
MTDSPGVPSSQRGGKKRAPRGGLAKAASSEPVRPPLTPRQRDVLEIVKTSIEEHGYPPTVREICEKIGANSPNAGAFHLKELVRKGYLEKAGRRGRALTVVVLPSESGKTIPFLGKIS